MNDVDHYILVIKTEFATLGVQFQEFKEDEKQLIVNIEDMEQGHWFNCSEGIIIK